MGVESHLSLDATSGDFIVDMSSVIRTPDLGSNRVADLARFTDLVKGLAVFARDEQAVVYGVADWSLLRLRALTGEERATLKRWYHRGLIEVLDGADDRILELADATGMAVVSRDGYADYCRRYPWVAGNRDRFFLPCPGPDGVGVSVRPRTMPVPTEAQMSRKEEEGLLLEAGMYDRAGGTGPRRELLSRRWSCPESGCPLFGAARSAVQPVPRYRNGVVKCPTHGVALVDVGGYPRRVQVKVRVAGTVRTRFLLEPRHEVAVGRAPQAPGISLVPWLGPLDEEAADLVSRSHVVLRWDGWKLTVVDTSRNGTLIRREGPQGREEFRLTAGASRKVRPRDDIVLVDGLELLLSARQFVFDESDDGADAVGATGWARQADQETACLAEPGDGRA